MRKLSFEVIDYWNSKIAELAPDADTFVSMWLKYLTGSGWTEEQYLQHIEREFCKDMSN